VLSKNRGASLGKRRGYEPSGTFSCSRSIRLSSRPPDVEWLLRWIQQGGAHRCCLALFLRRLTLSALRHRRREVGLGGRRHGGRGTLPAQTLWRQRNLIFQSHFDQLWRVVDEVSSKEVGWKGVRNTGIQLSDVQGGKKRDLPMIVVPSQSSTTVSLYDLKPDNVRDLMCIIYIYPAVANCAVIYKKKGEREKKESDKYCSGQCDHYPP